MGGSDCHRHINYCAACQHSALLIHPFAAPEATALQPTSRWDWVYRTLTSITIQGSTPSEIVLGILATSPPGYETNVQIAQWRTYHTYLFPLRHHFFPAVFLTIYSSRTPRVIYGTYHPVSFLVADTSLVHKL